MLRDIRAAPQRTRSLCLYSLRKPKTSWFDVTSPKGRQDIDLANISQPKRQTLLRPIDRLSAIWNLLCVHSRPKLLSPTLSGLPPFTTGQRTSLQVRFVPTGDSCIAAKAYSITASARAGNPVSRRSSVMRSFRPNVGQMQPPISRPPYMNDDDHRITAG